MSHKISLDTQTAKIVCVVNVGKEIELPLFEEFFINYCSEYAFIVHDKDIDKPIHYHFVANLKDKYKRDRLSTTLNKLVSCLKLDSAIGVQIEKYDSFERCLQYLTHKNDNSKFQYDSSDIITNLLPSDFNLFYNVDTNDVFSFDLCISIASHTKSKLEYIRQLFPYICNNSAKRSVAFEIWQLYHGK